MLQVEEEQGGTRNEEGESARDRVREREREREAERGARTEYTRRVSAVVALVVQNVPRKVLNSALSRTPLPSLSRTAYSSAAVRDTFTSLLVIVGGLASG